jgi:hypothetical protein
MRSTLTFLLCFCMSFSDHSAKPIRFEEEYESTKLRRKRNDLINLLYKPKNYKFV